MVAQLEKRLPNRTKKKGALRYCGQTDPEGRVHKDQIVLCVQLHILFLFQNTVSKIITLAPFANQVVLFNGLPNFAAFELAILSPTGFERPQIRPFCGLRYSRTKSFNEENFLCCTPFNVFKKNQKIYNSHNRNIRAKCITDKK